MGVVTNLRDGFTNLLAGLGVPGRDKFMSQQYAFTPMSLYECEIAYRGDWIARKCVDIPAFDMTREWRAWQADQDQITLLETCERELFVQQKVQQALVKARLYGGSGIVIGVEAGNPEEELDPETVGEGDLKFLHVVPWQYLSMGPLVWDVTSRYWGQPSWYQLNTLGTGARFGQPSMSAAASLAKGPGSDVKLHPSRVVRFVGLPPPDVLTSATMSFGDSVLQPVNDAIKMCGMVNGSLATLISEMKVDVIKVPNLSEALSTDTGTSQLIKRFSNANVAKSVINTILLDSGEEWQRISTNLSGAQELLTAYLQIASGAADIPASRFLGLPHKGLNTTGEADFRNYYDRLSSEQSVSLTPAMNILDEVLIRSALGDRPDEVYYEWNSLWQMTDAEKADLALKKAQTYKIDADEGQIPSTALAHARINQLIEDGFYPGLEQALEDAAAEGDTVEEQNAPAPPPPQLAPFTGGLPAPNEQPAPPADPIPPQLAPPKPPGANDGRPFDDGGPGSGPRPGQGRISALKQRMKDFVQSGQAKEAIGKAADKALTKAKESQKELLSGAVTFGLYHVAGADFPADVEHAIHDQVAHLSENLAVTKLMAVGMMKDAVSKLKSLRGIKDSIDDDVELDAALVKLSKVLDKLEAQYKQEEEPSP
jgi:phage-related protein (TIGR01555 family)